MFCALVGFTAAQVVNLVSSAMMAAPIAAVVAVVTRPRIGIIVGLLLVGLRMVHALLYFLSGEGRDGY